MTWNIQTFGGATTDRQSPRYYAVLETLKRIDADIYALQEIVKNGGDKKAKNLAEDLNKFEETKTDNRNTWEIQTLLSENPNKKGQAEYFAFLYKSNKVSASNLRLFLDAENSIDFASPPLLADFQLLNSKDKFTLGTFHLDAPGAKKGKEEASVEFSGQGAQEVKEAIGLAKIFETFKAENTTGDLIIMGDSNIKDNHSEKIFQSDTYVNLNVKTGYRDFANNLKNYRTTFNGEGWKESKGNDNYKNSYDKFLILDQGPTNVELAQPEEYRVNVADAFLPPDKGGYLDKMLASEYYIKVKKDESKYKDANSVPISALLSNFTDHAPAVIFYTYTVSDNK
ncbi:endonuclease/exonuclease/phosphatase family protein [Mycoplasmopsis columbinasalis]|uniref:Membrane nuclease MnuA n=1 Tax=Mycoplasmopsis columbinasalis TaxID=114880 RepID=A0A449BA75_9BACT|nr:endonuclease/exonuclease/phosphatase family protein [Mycoplasmopsis columbinasalis]VEU78101.1 Membrane nuclease MnuA [Mycoplasmopsis columbinasalis]